MPLCWPGDGACARATVSPSKGPLAGCRWFVLAVESGYLYYFKSPDQMSSPGVSPKVSRPRGE